ncbi:hypothetical protein [Streptomyces griseus]|uniref:hypothetical protein n=1 Tax=Streptomyces griseus TaxID=1911 RepID=UPI001EF38D64
MTKDRVRSSVPKGTFGGEPGLRTAVAGLLPEHTAIEENAPAPQLPVTLDRPGKVAGHLRTTELEPAERAALDQGVAVLRGQGYTLRVSAALAVHRRLLARCHPLDGRQGVPAGRRLVRLRPVQGSPRAREPGQRAHALTKIVPSTNRCTEAQRSAGPGGPGQGCRTS